MTDDEMIAIGKRTKPDTDAARLLAQLLWTKAELEHERMLNAWLTREMKGGDNMAKKKKGKGKGC